MVMPPRRKRFPTRRSPASASIAFRAAVAARILDSSVTGILDETVSVALCGKEATIS
jgi:hypothetical protein